MPDVYLQELLYFPCTDSRIINVLRNSLADTIKQIPSLAASIVRKKSHRRDNVQLGKPFFKLEDIITYQDVSANAEYDDFRATSFQSQHTKGGNFIPSRPKTLKEAETAAVLHVDVLRMKGGMVICVFVHHHAMDIAGIANFLRTWAAFSRMHDYGAGGFAGDVQECVQNRSIFDSHAVLGKMQAQHPDFHAAIVPTKGKAIQQPPAAAKEIKTALLLFTLESLETLRKEMTDSKQSSTPIERLSIDECVTALLWCCVLAAQKHSFTPPPTALINICMAVDIRDRLSPEGLTSYIGNAIAMTYPQVEYGTLQAGASDIATAAEVATIIHIVTTSVDEAYMNDLLAYVVAHRHDSKMIWGPPSTDIVITSLADQGVYELEWHTSLGRCEAVRCPPLKIEIGVVLPRLLNGGLEVLVGMEEATLLGLKQTELLRRFAKTMW
jgi:hypothetical protein